ncbi:MAG: flagellar basal body-associated FliL family protein [Nitrospiraceae bacterium]
MAEDAAEEKKAAAPAGVLPIKMVIIIAVVVLLIGAGGAVAFMSMTKGHDKPAGEQEAAESEDGGAEHDKGGGHGKAGGKGPGPMFDLEPFLVNLTDPNDPHYLKLTLKLELDRPETAELLAARNPQVRDAVLILLSSRDSESVRTAQGKLQLREELLTKINSLLPKGGVKGAYFTDFIVQ